MPATKQEIEVIARIAELHGSSSSAQPWAGRSLADLIELTEYRRVRSELTERDLEAWLAPRRDVVQQWLGWGEDKRTSGGSG